MDQYTVRRGDTLKAIAKRLGIQASTLIAANRQIENPDKIYVGQFINLPVDSRHPVGSPSGPTLSNILGPGAVAIDGNPANDPRYVQNAVVAVGIPIWGGAFALYRKVTNGRASDENMLRRDQASIFDDPLKSSYSEIRALYSTRQYADAAVVASKFNNAFTYYIGEGGMLYPTVISDTSAPALCDALRKAVEQERKDAQAAAKLGTDLLLWYVGARFPPTTGGGPAKAPGAAADAALVGFNAAEKAVIAETRQMLASPEMMQIRHAQALDKEITLKIGGRLIQYEPKWPFSGITNFEGNGFTIGGQAFSSESELIKTLLHELYRLTTSVARGSAGGGVNNAETTAAFEFAERGYQAAFAVPK
jgi:LysM repeat protein